MTQHEFEEKALRDILDEVRRKIALEETIKPKVRWAFGKLIGSFQRFWPVHQILPPKFDHVTRFTGVLRTHYGRVGRAFRDVVAEGVSRRLSQEQIAVRDNSYRLWVEHRSPLQAAAVVNTSLRQMAASIPAAMRTLHAQGMTVTPQSTARVAANALRIAFSRRVDGIATYETQTSAETIKLMEAQVMTGRLSPGQIPLDQQIQMIKSWNSQRDTRVRAGHVRADGQTVMIDQPFIVDYKGRQERLLIPGDRSLGASLGNVMKCRCGAEYEDVSQ
jgi:hypothetical protein